MKSKIFVGSLFFILFALVFNIIFKTLPPEHQFSFAYINGGLVMLAVFLWDKE